MAFDVLIKIFDNCKLTTLSSELSYSFGVNCNGYFDQFSFDQSISENEIETIQNVMSYIEGPIHKIVNHEQQMMILFKCNGENRNHLLHFYNPINHNFGLIFGLPTINPEYEEYNYHCLKSKYQSDIISTLQKITEIEIISNKKYPADEFFGLHMFSTSEIANKLSKVELETLLLAYEEKYYEIPRKIKTSDLAKKMGVSRYIFENNLKKAENSIMNTISTMLL